MNKIIVHLIDMNSLNNSYLFYLNIRTFITTTLRFNPLTLTIRIHLREDSIICDTIALNVNKIKAFKRRV
jgi:hypothetical protein